MFPSWDVASHATFGSPAWEILDTARQERTELIIVGSHGRSFVGRFVLGSVSQKVLNEAPCSVRVARGRVETDAGPQRILIAFDGSKGAFDAVASVASRYWSDGADVRLVFACGTGNASARFVERCADQPAADAPACGGTFIKEAADKAIDVLEKARLRVSFSCTDGNARSALLEEAERWSADSIFVGANAGTGGLREFVLGSTAAAIAARASCSVEVVRPGFRR